MVEKRSALDQRERRGTLSLGFGVAGAVAAGAGLLLWSRTRIRGAKAEESTAEEVEAHPS
ncbi:MAG TPA: hypothetical protein VF680_15250 [Allosphingosinicella sp.]|jgi:hypothetical protein